MVKVIYKKKEGIYLVESFTTPNTEYEVDLRHLTDGICTCKAFKKSNIFCKHIKEVKSRIKDNYTGIEERWEHSIKRG